MANPTRKSPTFSPEIALAFRVGVPHLERVAQGIREYAQKHTDWRFLISPETHDLPPASLEGWRGAGVIALCNTPEDETLLSRLNCPVVNISGALEVTRFMRVRNDYREIGRKAGRYLRHLGFRRFGFYGVSGVWYSSEIESGFREAIHGMGFEAETHRSTSSLDGSHRWNQGQDKLEQWLKTMTPPFAVLAAHDPRATMVIRACERVGLRVPEDVAVMGVNDDTVTCETIRPHLTSIERNGNAVGLKIAETLDRMIRGENFGDEIVLPPGDINERESTKTLAIDHPGLHAAVSLVEEKFQEPLSVDQLAEAAGKSRRWLEDTFRKELDCSPAEFLTRIRVGHANRILEQEPSIALGALANRCGFSGTRQLNQAFLRVTGARVRSSG